MWSALAGAGRGLSGYSEIRAKQAENDIDRKHREGLAKLSRDLTASEGAATRRSQRDIASERARTAKETAEIAAYGQSYRDAQEGKDIKTDPDNEDQHGRRYTTIEIRKTGKVFRVWPHPDGTGNVWIPVEDNPALYARKHYRKENGKPVYDKSDTGGEDSDAEDWGVRYAFNGQRAIMAPGAADVDPELLDKFVEIFGYLPPQLTLYRNRAPDPRRKLERPDARVDKVEDPAVSADPVLPAQPPAITPDEVAVPETPVSASPADQARGDSPADQARAAARAKNQEDLDWLTNKWNEDVQNLKDLPGNMAEGAGNFLNKARKALEKTVRGADQY
jgi:hypothetical protein